MDDLEDLARRQARAQNGLDPTHARPQPWFVGSGRGLMLLVLALMTVFIVMRGVPSWWAASTPLMPSTAMRAQPAPREVPLRDDARGAVGVNPAE